MIGHHIPLGPSTLLDHALCYALLGWPVFPCNPSAEKDAAGRSKSKKPLTDNGHKDATTDFEAIIKWWTLWPDALIGVPMGHRSEVFAIDPDAPDNPNESDGLTAWRDLVAKHGLPAETHSHSTPGGGMHVLFKWREDRPVTNREGALPEGINVRGEGGYIIVPPSRLSNGRTYGMANPDTFFTFEEAPDWLYDLLESKREKLKVSTDLASLNGRIASVNFDSANFDSIPCAAAALRRESEAVTNQSAGGRNNRLNEAAFNLGQLVGGGVLNQARVESELLNAAIECGLAADDGEAGVLSTIASGIEAGKEQPRGVPERDGAGSDHSEPPRPPIRATPYVWTDPNKVPRRDFLYGRHLIRGYVSATVAPGGVGKSALKIAEALSMASGRDLLEAGTLPSPRRVWYWNLEDPQDELVRRVQTAAKRYGIESKDIGGNLFIDIGREKELVIAESRRDGTLIIRPTVENIIAEIKRNAIDVLIIDPFVSCHRVSENDNSAMDTVAKEWGRVAHLANCAVELVHHTRKRAFGEREVTTESSRGGKALTDACRSVITINKMTREEGEKAGVDNHQRYFRTFNDKNNLAPPPEVSVWFKIESVYLGNGAVFGEDGDNVGVVVRWQWPDVAEGLSASDLRRIQERISTGTWRESPQANDWAGKAVAEVLNLDIARKADRAKVRRLLESWIASGSFVVIEGTDSKRTKRKFIKVGTRADDPPATPR